MAKSADVLGVHVGPASEDDEFFAGPIPDPVLLPCIFDEATCGTSEEETINKGTPLGILPGKGLDEKGRPTVGVHDKDAVDGRENPAGLLLYDILEAKGDRVSPEDCACVMVVGGRVWDSVIPDGTIDDVAGHGAKAARGDVGLSGTASEADTVTVTVDGNAVDVDIANGDTAAQAAGKIAEGLNQDAAFKADFLAVPVTTATDGTAARIEIIALRPGAWGNDISLAATSETTGLSATASGASLEGGLNDNSYRKQTLLRNCPSLILEVE